MTDPLAYMTAKSNGLEDECQSILDASGLTEDQVSLPSMGKPLTPPTGLVPTFKTNWPTKATSHTVFEQALLGQGDEESEAAPVTNGLVEEEQTDTFAEAQENGHMDAGEEDDAGGWDVEDEEPVEVEGETAEMAGPGAGTGAGSSEADIWSRTSPIAADHVAAGSFESAMQLLNRQIAAVNFAPLQDRFEEVYQASRTFLPANPGMVPLINYVRRTVEETDPARIQPIIPRDITSILSTEVQAGKKLMRENKLEDGVRTFKRVLHLLLVNAASSQQQASEVGFAMSVYYFSSMILTLIRLVRL